MNTIHNMKAYGIEAVEQDLGSINRKAGNLFTSQVNRLMIESARIPLVNPSDYLLPDLEDYWTHAQEGFVLTQKMATLKKYNIDPQLMLRATRDLPFTDMEDILMDLGLTKLKTNIHSNPRLSTYGVTVATLSELAAKGSPTLGNLGLPFEQMQPILDATNVPINWNRPLSPEHIWYSMQEIREWTKTGLVKTGILSRKEAEQVIAATQFFGLATRRLQRALPPAD